MGRMNMLWSLLVLLLLAEHPTATAGLRFIAIPKTGGSPALDLMAVAAKLQSRGHSVLAVAVEPAVEFMKLGAARHSSNTTAEAIQYLGIPDMGIGAVEGAASSIPPEKMTKLLQAFLVPKSLFASLTVGAKMLLAMKAFGAQPCQAMAEDAGLMQRLREFQADAVMVLGIPVSAIGDNCGCLMAQLLGVPFIDFYPGVSKMPYGVPQFGSFLSPSDLRTPQGWAKNTAIWLLNQLAPTLEAVFNPWAKTREALGLPMAASGCPLVNGVMRLRGRRAEACRAAVEVVLGSWVLENKQTLAANQVLVGPGTPRAAHPITPPEVADFVNNSRAGVVLVAFGSTAQSASLLSREDFVQLAQGFADLAPVRVLWPLKEVALPTGVTVAGLNLASNVKIVPWVDYNDVLGHPATIAVVSHSGVHSLYEAAYHGVPMVSVPFMFEAAEYAAKYAATGASLISHQAPAYRLGGPELHFTRQHIAEVIKQVVDDPSYKAAASRLSLALKTYAKYRHPYDRAADEIELAVKTYQVQHGIPVQPESDAPAEEAALEEPAADVAATTEPAAEQTKQQAAEGPAAADGGVPNAEPAAQPAAGAPSTNVVNGHESAASAYPAMEAAGGATAAGVAASAVGVEPGVGGDAGEHGAEGQAEEEQAAASRASIQAAEMVHEQGVQQEQRAEL